eukprot:TRINITY_DN71311_c0_g1_i1.p1 TRINITY_DN71311_c0_g1~~TRINITY_DN71311_c0_g1_i1.p1  ORF type:complete len:139 (+),score=15.53 TRINITY_DN71311_c0_g1_i1:61-417(+)
MNPDPGHTSMSKDAHKSSAVRGAPGHPVQHAGSHHMNNCYNTHMPAPMISKMPGIFHKAVAPQPMCRGFHVGPVHASELHGKVLQMNGGSGSHHQHKSMMGMDAGHMGGGRICPAHHD